MPPTVPLKAINICGETKSKSKCRRRQPRRFEVSMPRHTTFKKGESYRERRLRKTTPKHLHPIEAALTPECVFCLELRSCFWRAARGQGASGTTTAHPGASPATWRGSSRPMPRHGTPVVALALGLVVAPVLAVALCARLARRRRPNHSAQRTMRRCRRGPPLSPLPSSLWPLLSLP